MRIPVFWSRETAKEMDRRGREVSFSCWGWSEKSEAEARESALAAARRVLKKYLAGEPRSHYAYDARPLREEVVQRFADADGRLYAAVTRNVYGALVLNTAGAMFIDMDFPEDAIRKKSGGFLSTLFRKKPAQDTENTLEEEYVARLEQFVNSHSQWGFRVYQTYGGLRALATHTLFEPSSPETPAVLEALGADALYIRLCKNQECFRARLTPKPWRCGYYSNTLRWPWENERQKKQFERWLSGYMSRQADYATCRYLRAIGNGGCHPEIEPILEVHDKITRCHEPLKLA